MCAALVVLGWSSITFTVGHERDFETKGLQVPGAVTRVKLLQAIEILDVTLEAKASIEGVPVWRS